MWSEIEADFGLNETTNFGERDESGTSLYQLITVATISQRDEELTDKPHVSSCACGDLICVAADRQLVVFSEGGRSVKSTIQYVTDVVAVCCSEDQSLIAVAEQSGVVHLLGADTCVEVFAKSLETVDESLVGPRTFVHLSIDHCKVTGTRLTVLTYRGIVHCIEGLDCVTALSNAIASKDLQTVKLLQTKIHSFSFDARAVHDTGVIAVHALKLSDDVVTCGTGEFSICVWRKEPGSDSRSMVPHRCTVHPMFDNTIWNIVKCCAVAEESKLIALDDRGRISLWSLRTCTLLREWENSNISDFIVIGDHLNSNAISNVHLFAVSPVPDSLEFCEVKIFALPSFEVEYSVKLNTFCKLIFCPSIAEELFVIEGKDISESGSPSSLHIRCLTESDPQSRLSRLLQKRKYEEAVDFCRMHDLDAAIVFKSKVSFLVDQLSHESRYSTANKQTLLEDLKSGLEKVSDAQFVAECCMSAPMACLESALEMLNLGRKRLLDAGLEDSATMKRCVNLIYLLGTFQMCFGSELYTTGTWQIFCSGKLVNQFMKCLYSGCMTAASVLWRRHLNQIFNSSAQLADQLQLWLDAIPEYVSLFELTTFLVKAIIPHIVIHSPDSIVVLVRWIEARVRDLEILNASEWPRNAFKFSRVLFDCLDDMSSLLSSNSKEFLTPEDYAKLVAGLAAVRSMIKQPSNQQVNKEENDLGETPQPYQLFRSLYSLSCSLSELCNLQEQYNCHLTLANCQLQTVESVVYRMLDSVAAAELIPAYIQKTVQPYVLERRLDIDLTLYHYVDDLTERCSRFIACMGVAPWELKAIQIIKCIANDDQKCMALLVVMSHAHIPYCSDLESLISEALISNKNQQTASIKEKLRLVELQRLVAGYGMRHFNMSERADIMTLTQCILSHGRSSSLSDALLVADFYNVDCEDVYLFQVRLIAEKDPTLVGRFFTDLALNHLVSVDGGNEENSGMIALMCAERFCRIARITSDDSLQLETMRARYVIALREALKFLLQCTDENEFLRDDWMEELIAIENTIALYNEFEELLYPSDIVNEESRLELLENRIRTEETIDGSVQQQSNVDLTYRDIVQKCASDSINENDECASADFNSYLIDSKDTGKGFERKKSTPKGKRVYRFAHLLQFTTEQMKAIEASQAITDRDYSTVKRLLVEIASQCFSNPENSLLLFYLVCNLIDSLKTDANCSVEILQEFCEIMQIVMQKILANVAGVCLMACIQVAQSIKLVNFIIAKCNRSNSIENQKEYSKLTVSLLYEEHFSEDGLVLNMINLIGTLYSVLQQDANVIKLLASFTQPVSRSSVITKLRKPFLFGLNDMESIEKEYWSVLTKLSEILEENLHMQLAMSASLHTLASMSFCFSVLSCSSVNVLDIICSNTDIQRIKEEPGYEINKENLPVNEQQGYAKDSNISPNENKLKADIEFDISELIGSENAIMAGSGNFGSIKQLEELLNSSRKSITVQSSLNEREQVEKLIRRLLTLLSKIFGRYPIDRCLAVNYLTAISHKRSALKSLLAAEKAAGCQYKRARSVAQVGMIYCLIENIESTIVERVNSLLNSADWGYRLAKLKISFREAFCGSMEDKNRLVQVLARTSAMKTSEVVEYCKTFSYDLVMSLMTCIECLLVTETSLSMQDLKFFSATTSNALIDIGTAISRAEEFCCILLNLGANDLKLYNMLDCIYRKLDPCDYERIKFVLSWLYYLQPSDMLKRNIDLLNCLQSYRSVGSLSMGTALSANITKGVKVSNSSTRRYSGLNKPILKIPQSPKHKGIDKAGRLPYHDILGDDYWKIISAELNLATYQKFLHIAKILGLASDKIIMTTLRNVVRYFVENQSKGIQKVQLFASHNNLDKINGRGLLDSSKAGGSCGSERLEEDGTKSLFASIDKLISMLSSLENAVQCAAYIVTEMTRDSDKVQALKFCIRLCQQWEEGLKPGSVEASRAHEVCKQHIKLHNNIATKHVLIEYSLDDSENLSLVSAPARLLFRLYEHESVEKQGQLISACTYLLQSDLPIDQNSAKLPNVNEAADKIASINKVKIKEVRRRLVQEWLPSILKNRQEELDMTMNPDALSEPVSTRTNDHEIDERNLYRVVYILAYDSPGEVADLLVQFISASSSTSLDITSFSEVDFNESMMSASTSSFSCYVRALRVLFTIVDVYRQMNSRMSVRCHRKLVGYMYLDHLMRAGVAMVSSVEEFVKTSKEGLARSVWFSSSSGRSSFSNVWLVASLCLDFSLVDSMLWKDIVGRICRILRGEESACDKYLSADKTSRALLLKLLIRLCSCDASRNVLHSLRLVDIISLDEECSAVSESEVPLLCEMIYHWPAAIVSSDLLPYLKLFLNQLRCPAYTLACSLLVPSGEQQKSLCDEIISKAASDVQRQLESLQTTNDFFPHRDVIGRMVNQHFHPELIPVEDVCPTQYSVKPRISSVDSNDSVFVQ